MTKTKSLTYFSPGLQQVARQAKDHPEWQFTTLAHHIDIDLLREAHRRTRKKGAVGVDGQTSADYEVDLENNLQALLDRAKTGQYRAPPVRRTYIPKSDGRMRPLGIPTFEDKVLQRAVVMALEALYEQDFMDFSYGFRRHRSAHDAVSALREGVMGMGGGYVLEADISDCFGAIPHKELREVLSQRMRDGVLKRLIGKWLNAGVMEDGSLTRTTTGTPQGGVISPLLANVFMHTVLDVWFEHEVQPRLHGKAFIIRFADDFVIVFANRSDAERVYEVLPKRFAKFGLTLHPEKTKLLDFQRPGAENTPESFDFLGFTHYWSRARRGHWVVKRKTAAPRLRRALRAIKDWCRKNRHLPVKEQHAMLCRKLRGHCNYYGITGNSSALGKYRYGILRIWRKWLMRRSGAARQPWSWWTTFLQRYALPSAIATRSDYRSQ